MLKPKRLLVLLSILFASLLTAQSEDSLRKACTGKNDSLVIDAHLQLSKYYFNTLFNMDSVISTSLVALELTQKHPYGDQEYRASNFIATGYLMQDKFDVSKIWLDKTLALAIKSDEGKNVADVYQMYAVYYGNQEMADSSLVYLIKEADVAQQAKYYSGQASAYTHIARNYKGQGQQDKQLLYHRKALEVVSKMEESNIGNIIQVYVTCAEGFTGMTAFPEIRQVLMDSARILADSALQISIRYNRTSPRASAYYVYSQCDLYDKQYEAAIGDIQRALALRDYLGGSTITILHASMALAQSFLGNHATAIQYLDSARSDPYAKELYYQNHIADVAYQVYKNAGDMTRALQAHEEYKLTSDSLAGIEKAKAIGIIEQQFNKAENERTIKELAQEQEIGALRNKFLTAGIVIAVLIIISGFVLFRQRAIKNKQNLLEAEQRLNRARMNPHFFFNTLTSLQTYALDEEDRTKVANFISKYSKIMRKTLESTYEEFVPVSDEIEFLDQYLQLQRLRLEGKFEFSIAVDETLDPDEFLIPTMLLQPFIENSIEHGFAGLKERGMVNVDFEKSSDGIEIRVSDNGSGFAPKKQDPEHKSRATEISRDRLLLLNTKYKSKASFEVKTNPAGSGTLVVFHLPNISR